jgi:hypothetical protein
MKVFHEDLIAYIKIEKFSFFLNFDLIKNFEINGLLKTFKKIK